MRSMVEGASCLAQGEPWTVLAGFETHGSPSTTLRLVPLPR